MSTCPTGIAHPRGFVTAHALFALPGHDLRPDVAFVSFDRWPQSCGIPRSNAWPVVPDLAAEVVSPNDGFRDVTAKPGTYFESGVRAVWLVDPRAEQVHLYFARR